ncbi:hypothetical protein LY76DRAFT_377718 [Colletotrichum caudatum]|nr:hypothetical protein LY76DRAFT_377718 [Colletotrichum caudatum]
MPISLDNISFYSAPAQDVRSSAARNTKKQTLDPCLTMGRTPIPAPDATITGRDEITSHSDEKSILLSRSPEATFYDTVTPKDKSYLRIECSRASGDVDHSPAKKPVVVDFNKRENSPEPAAWSTSCLPVPLPSLPSEGFDASMFPSHPGSQAAKNTADPAIPQNSTKNALTVSLETPAQESTPHYAEQLPQVSQAADNDSMTWLQHEELLPSSDAEVGEASGSSRRTSETSGTMQRPAVAECGLPYSSFAPLSQDAPYCTENHTSVILGQETLNPWPNVGDGESRPDSSDRSEPPIKETPFYSSNCSPSLDEMHVDAETTAPGAPPASLSLVHRRARKSRLPAGAYAEANSDPESSDEDGAHGTNDDCVGDQANSGRNQQGPQGYEDNTDQRRQPKPKFRKRNFQETVSTTRALRPRDTTSQSALEPRRSSRRVTKRPRTSGVLSPPVSSASTDDEIDPKSFFARYDEWPLKNAVLKRITDGSITTFQLQWEQSSTERQETHCYPSVGRASGSSTKTQKSARRSAKSRCPFSEQENKLLVQLKGQGLPWKKIHSYFPDRSLGTLQVHFSTKLNMTR